MTQVSIPLLVCLLIAFAFTLINAHAVANIGVETLPAVTLLWQTYAVTSRVVGHCYLFGIITLFYSNGNFFFCRHGAIYNPCEVKEKSLSILKKRIKLHKTIEGKTLITWNNSVLEWFSVECRINSKPKYNYSSQSQIAHTIQ